MATEVRSKWLSS